MSANGASADVPSASVAGVAATAAAAAAAAATPTFAFVPPPLSSSSDAAAAASDALAAASPSEPVSAADAEYASLVSRLSAAEKASAGRDYLKSGNTDKAVDMLAMALEEFVQKYGEFSLHCAPVYRSYGAALLQHYQAHSSVLGDVMNDDEEKKKKILGDASAEEEVDAEEDGEGEAAPQSDSEDLTLAYQILETARVIYARHYTGPGKIEESRADEEGAQQEEQKEALRQQEQAEQSADASSSPVDTSLPSLSQKDIGLSLSSTYETLASFFMEREDFGAAFADFTKALALAEQHLPPHSRDIAALHMDLSVCALFDSQPEKALESYKAATAALQRTCAHIKDQIKKEEENPTPVTEESDVAAASSSAAAAAPAAASAATSVPPPPPSSLLARYQAELAECEDILDEVKERIEDITAQLSLPAEDQALALIKQQNLSGAINAAPAAAAAAVNPFAMPTPDAAAATNPFAMPASSAPAAAAAATPTHAPQVKRKPKPAAPAAPAAAAATTTALVDRTADEDGAAAKRIKAE